MPAGEKFRGQHVIVTATLGCLKAGDIKFEPELPKYKKDAIAALGFGNLNKVGWVIEQHAFSVVASKTTMLCRRLHADVQALLPVPGRVACSRYELIC